MIGKANGSFRRVARTFDATSSQRPTTAPLFFLYPRWCWHNSSAGSFKKQTGRTKELDRRDGHGPQKDYNQASTLMSLGQLSASRAEVWSSHVLPQFVIHPMPGPRLRCLQFSTVASAGQASNAEAISLEHPLHSSYQANATSHRTRASRFAVINNNSISSGRTTDDRAPKNSYDAAASSYPVRPRGIPRRVRLPGQWNVRQKLQALTTEKPGFWEIPLRLLEAHTPSKEEAAGTVRAAVLLPESVISNLMAEDGSTMWDLAMRFDCQAHIMSSRYSVEGRRPVMLVGKRRSVELATTAIRRMAGEQNPDTPESEEWIDPVTLKPDQGPQITMVNTASGAWPQIPVGGIPYPETWTPQTFALYVRRICGTRINRSMHRTLYGRGTTHVESVSSLLASLFAHPAAEPLITTSAVNSALIFYEKHGQFRAARLLLEDMLIRGSLPDVSSFNILLRGAAKDGNVRVFVYFLRRMLDLRITPTDETWIALLMVPYDMRAKLEIFQTMRHKGLLQQLPVFRDAVAQVVWEVADTWLRDGGDARALLGRLDAHFGPRWLSTDAVNRLTDALGRRGLVAAHCLPLWDAALRRRVRVDVVAVNTLLGNCAREPSAGKAADVVRLAVRVLACAERLRIALDGISFRVLFRLVRSCHLYNCARAVWRHACMEGLVSYQMQQWTLQSLLSNVSHAASPVVAAWATIAGKVLVGIETPAPLPAAAPPPASAQQAQEPQQPQQQHQKHPPDSEVEVMCRLCRWTAVDAGRTPARLVAQQMLARDLDAYRWVQPAQPLSMTLAVSLERDLEWAQRRLDPDQLLTEGEWMVRHAIEVPHRPRAADMAADGTAVLAGSGSTSSTGSANGAGASNAGSVAATLTDTDAARAAPSATPPAKSPISGADKSGGAVGDSTDDVAAAAAAAAGAAEPPPKTTAATTSSAPTSSVVGD